MRTSDIGHRISDQRLTTNGQRYGPGTCTDHSRRGLAYLCVHPDAGEGALRGEDTVHRWRRNTPAMQGTASPPPYGRSSRVEATTQHCRLPLVRCPWS